MAYQSNWYTAYESVTGKPGEAIRVLCSVGFDFKQEYVPKIYGYIRSVKAQLVKCEKYVVDKNEVFAELTFIPLSYESNEILKVEAGDIYFFNVIFGKTSAQQYFCEYNDPFYLPGSENIRFKHENIEPKL